MFYTRLLAQQLESVCIHAANLVAKTLGDDYLSSGVRKSLFRLLGAKFGPGTSIKGGGYVYGGGLTTGANCYINRGCYFDMTAKITLGSNVVVGHGVTFITAEHGLGGATRRAGKVRGWQILIEDGVWVGANATILPGVTVGRGAVVAAGSVVNKDVPANVVVAGVPSKMVRNLES